MNAIFAEIAKALKQGSAVEFPFGHLRKDCLHETLPPDGGTGPALQLRTQGPLPASGPGSNHALHGIAVDGRRAVGEWMIPVKVSGVTVGRLNQIARSRGHCQEDIGVGRYTAVLYAEGINDLTDGLGSWFMLERPLLLPAPPRYNSRYWPDLISLSWMNSAKFGRRLASMKSRGRILRFAGWCKHGWVPAI